MDKTSKSLKPGNMYSKMIQLKSDSSTNYLRQRELETSHLMTNKSHLFFMTEFA